MSLGYPPVRPQADGVRHVDLPAGPYGMPDTMIHGLSGAKVHSASKHPLEHTEANWASNQNEMDLAMLRNTQGLHAPLRLKMERNLAANFRRLPCLHSSNLLDDTLSGREDLIGFGDILNSPFEAETVGNAHVLMEKRAKIL